VFTELVVAKFVVAKTVVAKTVVAKTVAAKIVIAKIVIAKVVCFEVVLLCVVRAEIVFLCECSFTRNQQEWEPDRACFFEDGHASPFANGVSIENLNRQLRKGTLCR
jgi:hypothetical protein